MKKQIFLQELSTGKTHVISLPCVVGRDIGADLTLDEISVSRRHARLDSLNDDVFVEDLESRNGVHVNGERIENQTVLKPGDFIQLGKTKLRVSFGEEDFSEHSVILHTLDLRNDSQLDHQRLKLIYEITKDLAENHNLQGLGETLFSKLKDAFKQDRGYLALFQQDGSLKPVFLDPPVESVPLSRSIVDRVFRNGESFILADALDDESLKAEESIMAFKIRSALCVPLIYHNQIYGLFYLDRNIPGAYAQDDLELLRTISYILAPLIENARLWSELKGHYESALVTLRETQARLIEMERAEAYVRLAQAMAHEIRNPLMVIGGMVKRMAHSEADGPDNTKVRAVMESVERIAMVLKEVDIFVKLPQPERKLARIDNLIQERIEAHTEEWRKHQMQPVLTASTSHVMIPVDRDLFQKAISMIFLEILSNVPRGSELGISIRLSGNDVEVLFGEADSNQCRSEIFDPELQHQPWSLGLFLNIAHKVISDHGGKLLVDPTGHSPFPILVRMPRTLSI